jgi:hypothetical protein
MVIRVTQVKTWEPDFHMSQMEQDTPNPLKKTKRNSPKNLKESFKTRKKWWNEGHKSQIK